MGDKLSVDEGMNGLIIKRLEEAGGSAVLNLSRFSRDNGFYRTVGNAAASILEAKGILKIERLGSGEDKKNNHPRLTLVEEVLEKYRRGETLLSNPAIPNDRPHRTRKAKNGQAAANPLVNSVLEHVTGLKKYFGDGLCDAGDVKDLLAATMIIADKACALEIESVKLGADLEKLTEAARGLGADDTEISQILMKKPEASEEVADPCDRLPQVPYVLFQDLLRYGDDIPGKVFKTVGLLQRDAKELRNEVLDKLLPKVIAFKIKQIRLEQYIHNLWAIETVDPTANMTDWRRRSDAVVSTVVAKGIATVSSKA